MPRLSRALLRQPHLPRFLCHVYQRLRQNRLNLVTGAGISIDAKVPSWFGLLDRLAEITPELKTDLEAHKKAGLQPEYLGQILYHRHKGLEPNDVAPDIRKVATDYAWATAIHEALYRDVRPDIDEIVRHHPYLSELRNLARHVPLVINFNFDDLLADAIGRQIAESGAGRPLSVVWHPPLLERQDHTTIYHVNGIIPRVSLKKRSRELVFTEDSFADVAARSPGISAEYIFLRFVQNTMLLIGHSLGDSSLKNFLRRNRDKSPANHHYMIHWIESDDALSEGRRRDIFDANLELYNLITIFLTTSEIKEFLDVLNKDPRAFAELIEEFGDSYRHRYHYYIVGPVAAGKSSLLEHMRCFATHEEWTRPPPPEMYMSFEKLTDTQKAAVDSFVYGELKEKNRRLHDSDVGIFFMDRAPLDLYAFSESDDERIQKTKEIKKRVTRDRELHSGQIVFIWAEGHCLVTRNYGRGRPPETSGQAEYYDRQTAALRDIYKPVLEIQTDRKSVGEIAREVARHAIFGPYTPTNLTSIMSRYA